MHSKTINHRLVAVEKIDSQEAIHTWTASGAAPGRKIPSPHGMCSRLVGANLNIIDFASLALASQPHHTIHIFFPFCEWHTERSQYWRCDDGPARSCVDDKTGGAPIQFAGDIKFVTCPLHCQWRITLFHQQISERRDLGSAKQTGRHKGHSSGHCK